MDHRPRRRTGTRALVATAPADRPYALRWLAAAAGVGFLLLGLLAAVVGPLLPGLRDRFGLGATGGSLLLSAFSAGAVVGVILAGNLLPRTSPRRLLGAAATGIGAGSLVVAAAPSAVTVGLALFAAGVAFGAIDITLNLVLARSYRAASGAVLTALSAAFGVGAIAGPLLVGHSPDDSRGPFLLCALLAVVLLPLTFLVTTGSGTPERAAVGVPRVPGETRLLAGFAVALLLYVTVEIGVAGWETTHLIGAGLLSHRGSANATALFWLGLTVGRLAAAPLALRVPAGTLAAGAMALAALALATATQPRLAVAAYAVTGLALAPVFPTIIAWLAATVPTGRGATPVFAAGLFGPVLSSPLLGAGVDHVGTRSIPLILLGLAALTLAACLDLLRRLV